MIEILDINGMEHSCAVQMLCTIDQIMINPGECRREPDLVRCCEMTFVNGVKIRISEELKYSLLNPQIVNKQGSMETSEELKMNEIKESIEKDICEQTKRQSSLSI